MGAGGSTGGPSFEAFQLVQEEHKRLQDGFYAESNVIDMDEVSEQQRAERLFFLYHAIVEELREGATLSSRVPALMVRQWQQQTPAEVQAYLSAFLEAVIAQDARDFKPAAVAADYSKSFSGSAADTKNEKDAAALMRNDGGGAAGEASTEPDAAEPILVKPRLGQGERDFCGQGLDRHLLRTTAPFLRFMGKGQCYLYAHPLTKEVVSLRPQEYDPEQDLALPAEAGAGGGDSRGETAAAADEGWKSCALTELPAAVDAIVASGKTPLILDPSPEASVRVFFSIKHALVDASHLTVPFAKSGLKAR